MALDLLILRDVVSERKGRMVGKTYGGVVNLNFDVGVANLHMDVEVVHPHSI